MYSVQVEKPPTTELNYFSYSVCLINREIEPILCIYALHIYYYNDLDPVLLLCHIQKKDPIILPHHDIICLAFLLRNLGTDNLFKRHDILGKVANTFCKLFRSHWIFVHHPTEGLLV